MLNIGANDKLDLQPFTIKDSGEPLDVFTVLHAALIMVAAGQKASHLFSRRNVPKGESAINGSKTMREPLMVLKLSCPRWCRVSIAASPVKLSGQHSLDLA
ncbi:hypothetical protein AAC387_Pa04g2207 [Persea americana]